MFQYIRFILILCQKTTNHTQCLTAIFVLSVFLITENTLIGVIKDQKSNQLFHVAIKSA